MKAKKEVDRIKVPSMPVSCAGIRQTDRLTDCGRTRQAMITARRGKDESSLVGLCNVLFKPLESEWCLDEATQDESEKREEVKGKGKEKVEVNDEKVQKKVKGKGKETGPSYDEMTMTPEMMWKEAEKHAVHVYLWSAMHRWCVDSRVPAPAIGPLG